ncbi:MAG TPA: phage tail protein, partial [Pyrinomonadaceae bacterium]|nr:phage tail protein [Pyrinomonadaceae bacterium]
MAAIAIQVGLAVAVSAASSLFAKKPKQQALDRGRLDDLRVQTAEEGAFLPLVYGRRARLAGNIIDGEQTIEHVSHTEGRSGGKAGGGGRAAEPPTNNFTYTKTFAVLLTGNRIKRIRRVNEDLEVIYNDDGSDASINYYEAELAELSGTAAAGSGTSYSGGRAVATGAVGTIKFKQVVATITGAHFLTIYYKESTGVSVTVKTNGVAQTVALPATGSAVDTVEVSISLTAGRSNIIEIIYAGVGSTTIDRIQIARATGAGGGAPAPTGVIDPSGVYPTDIDNPRPFYNYSVLQDSTGLVEGVLAAGGQAPFEFFNGSEEQVQSAALVALHGADATPAYRECSLAVFEDWQLKDGKLGQMTFEVEPEIQLLDEIMVDLYTRVGEKESRLDFSALAGIVDDGFIVDQRTPLAEYITALQVWYNFDVVPCGGQIVAVPRGGASVATITEDKLAAHEEGTKRPTGSTTVSYPDPMDLPNSVDVVYLDPSPAKDYHSATEPAQLAIAGSYDPETLTFPKVGDADTAQQVGLRWLHEKHIESRPRTFVTGPEFRHLIPTDPVTLVLSNLTQRMRIVSKEAALQSLVRFKAVPESAAVYTQTGLGHQDDGAEHPVPPFAANTFLVIADVPPVRAENANQLGYIFGGCPIGAGVWTGYHLNKEEGNGEYSRLAGVSEAATIGIAENALTSGSPYLIDRTADGALVVNMLSVPAGGLESITEEEMFTTSKNTGVYGNEIIRWMTATPETPTAPYVARYRLTGLMHGVNGTEWAISEHTLADEQTRH